MNFFFYSIYIFLENSNHIFSTDLSGLQHVCTVRLFYHRVFNLDWKKKKQEAFTECCNLLLKDMENEVLIEQFASLHHWHMASHIRLLNSGRNRVRQQWQDKHAAVTASNYNGTNHIVLPVESLQTILTVVHIWCNKYCA